MAATLDPIDQKNKNIQLLRSSLSRKQRVREWIIEKVLLGCGLLSIAITLAIAGVIVFGSFEFFTHDEPSTGQHGEPGTYEWMTPEQMAERATYFVSGTQWGPIPRRYGILPLLVGTLVVAFIAALIALPIGLVTALYLSEYASPRVRGFAKPALEILAGIPTVVYGFFAITVVTPFLKDHVFPDIGDPNNQLSGGIVVAFMIIPMVASLSEDALRAVPRSLRDGAIALGANKFETSVKVVLPAALSGIIASFILAISRAVGETMAVTLACGSRPVLTFNPMEGAATMTSFIVQVAGGDASHGTTVFSSLFAVAGALFFITLFMNIIAQRVLRRFRQVYQ